MASSDLNPSELDELNRLEQLARNSSHYELLQIQPVAETADIQNAFYELSRKWHPDRFFRRDIGDKAQIIEEVFVAITEAYRTLSDAEMRRVYDRKLREEGKVQAVPKNTDGHQARLKRRSPQKASGPSSREALRERAAARKRERMTKRSRQLSPSMNRVRDQVVEQLRKARAYYKEGKSAYDDGNMIKAANALQLAVTYDPRNQTYKKLLDETKVLAKQAMVKAHISAAENAESFQNPREALSQYRKAVGLGTDNPIPHYRLAVLMQVYEDDPKGAVNHLRDAVKLAPKNISYRLALGKLYMDLGHNLNAKREFQYILHVEKGHSEAKSLLKKIR